MTDNVQTQILTAGANRVDGLRSYLVSGPTDEEILTYTRNADCQTALARSLAEYLESGVINWQGGRQIRFKKVIVQWAEPEIPAEWPSCAVLATSPADYDSSIPKTFYVDAAGKQAARSIGILTQNFTVIVWATDPAERAGLTSMLEDMLEPFDWMSGVRLKVPAYYGVHATYLKRTVQFDDDSSAAQKRWRRAIFSIDGAIPQLKMLGRVTSMAPVTTSVDVTNDPL